MKKVLTLAFILILSFNLCIPALALSTQICTQSYSTTDIYSTAVIGKCGENATWALTYNGVLTISGFGNMDDFSEDVLNPWFDIRASIIEVVIEEGVSLDEKRYFLNYELEGQKIDAYLVSEKDLSISEINKPIIIEEDIKVGSDFFYLEER